MVKHARLCRRLAVPLIVAFVLLFVFVPATLAATATATSHRPLLMVGPKKHYLALGDSLAFGFQPDLDFDAGYADDFYSNLKNHGVQSLANMGCPGETSVTFLNGKCPYPYLRKFPYIGPQLNAAVDYIRFYASQVSPVTLDIGANDVNRDINPNTCVINQQQFQSDLATLDTNLTQVILPALKQALTVNGRMTGDILIMNYYDPYQNIIFTDIHATTRGYTIIANTFEAGYGY